MQVLPVIGGGGFNCLCNVPKRFCHLRQVLMDKTWQKMLLFFVLIKPLYRFLFWYSHRCQISPPHPPSQAQLFPSSASAQIVQFGSIFADCLQINQTRTLYWGENILCHLSAATCWGYQRTFIRPLSSILIYSNHDIPDYIGICICIVLHHPTL